MNEKIQNDSAENDILLDVVDFPLRFSILLLKYTAKER